MPFHRDAQSRHIKMSYSAANVVIYFFIHTNNPTKKQKQIIILTFSNPHCHPFSP